MIPHWYRVICYDFLKDNTLKHQRCTAKISMFISLKLRFTGISPRKNIISNHFITFKSPFLIIHHEKKTMEFTVPNFAPQYGQVVILWAAWGKRSRRSGWQDWNRNWFLSELECQIEYPMIVTIGYKSYFLFFCMFNGVFSRLTCQNACEKPCFFPWNSLIGWQETQKFGHRESRPGPDTSTQSRVRTDGEELVWQVKNNHRFFTIFHGRTASVFSQGMWYDLSWFNANDGIVQYTGIPILMGYFMRYFMGIDLIVHAILAEYWWWYTWICNKKRPHVATSQLRVNRLGLSMMELELGHLPNNPNKRCPQTWCL